MKTTVKTCFKCKAEKPITDFYVHPAMGDGRLNKCKPCTRKDVSKNYRVNRDYFRRYDKERNQLPERKARRLEDQRRKRRLNPQKYRANSAISNAVRDGRLAKPSNCSHCGSENNVQAHHHDYSKPLDVIWLCFKCHRAEHGQEATGDPF